MSIVHVSGSPDYRNKFDDKLGKNIQDLKGEVVDPLVNELLPELLFGPKQAPKIWVTDSEHGVAIPESDKGQNADVKGQ